MIFKPPTRSFDEKPVIREGEDGEKLPYSLLDAEKFAGVSPKAKGFVGREKSVSPRTFE